MPNFFSQIVPIKKFSNLTQLDNFAPCPADWSLVLTDIKGSTQAIEEGRYQDVNLLGAAAIVVIQNLLRSRDIPFSFGGDGATILIPSVMLSEVSKEMRKLKRHCREQFNLELRVGIIPAKEIYRQNGVLNVGRYELAFNNNIALFHGNGFALAETLLKDKESPFEIRDEVEEITPPDLENLSCRWSTVPSRNGVIAALLISAVDTVSSDLVYDKVLMDLEHFIIREKFNPIQTEKLKPKSFWRQFLFENKLQAKISTKKRILQFLLEYLNMSYALLTKKNLVSSADTLRYLKETPANCDYKKFDTILKMVVDCTPEDKIHLLEVLEKYKSSGEILYGVHFSNESIMTCVVHQIENNQHIHFIDGGNGGYAMAAKMLKLQKTENLN